jgi:tetratricopeptide (TPR) repeat protein
MAEQKHKNESLNVEEAVSQSEEFLIKNKKTIITAIVAVVVIVVGAFLYKNFYSEPREEKAQAALFKGQELFEQENFEVALNGDSVKYIGFIKVADQFSGTKAGNLANAYAGLCYAHLGEYEKALKYLDNFSAKDDMASAAIIAATGNCYAQLDKPMKAVEYLKKAADKAESNALSPIFLQQAGDILMQQKAYDEALKVYNEIKDKYFQSYQAMSIDKYIEKAELLNNSRK